MKLAAQLFLALLLLIPILALASLSLAGLFGLISIASLILAAYGSNHAVQNYDRRLIFFNSYGTISPWKLISLGTKKKDRQLIVGGVAYFLMVVFALLAVAAK